MTAEIRAGVRDLADRLTLEYAGAVPPGQVLALVFRAERSLGVRGRLPAATRSTSASRRSDGCSPTGWRTTRGRPRLSGTSWWTAPGGRPTARAGRRTGPAAQRR